MNMNMIIWLLFNRMYIIILLHMICERLQTGVLWKSVLWCSDTNEWKMNGVDEGCSNSTMRTPRLYQNWIACPGFFSIYCTQIHSNPKSSAIVVTNSGILIDQLRQNLEVVIFEEVFVVATVAKCRVTLLVATSSLVLPSFEFILYLVWWCYLLQVLFLPSFEFILGMMGSMVPPVLVPLPLSAAATTYNDGGVLLYCTSLQYDVVLDLQVVASQ